MFQVSLECFLLFKMMIYYSIQYGDMLFYLFENYQKVIVNYIDNNDSKDEGGRGRKGKEEEEDEEDEDEQEEQGKIIRGKDYDS